MLGLYLHIPFCRQKCVYCDFPSYAGTERFYDGYVQALCREIDASPYAGRAADTVYFGGGTPSLLPEGALPEILVHFRRRFSLTEDAEITVEANPESLTADKAAAWRKAGINRLSIGIQSFNDDLLAFLGRVHTAAEGKNAVLAAYDAGFRNLSLDLMYGLPGQSVEDVACDLLLLHELPVVHASIYSLIVEDGTRLKAEVERGKYTLPDDDLLEAMGKTVHEKMHAYGFQHYEVSSYAKPGYQSRHNSKYWQYVPYLGFGVSAHSFMEAGQVKGRALNALLAENGRAVGAPLRQPGPPVGACIECPPASETAITDTNGRAVGVPLRQPGPPVGACMKCPPAPADVYAVRWMNLRNIPQYIKRAGKETVIHDAVVITEKRAVEDYCFLALRRRIGIDAADFERRFGRSLETEFGPIIRQLAHQGLLEKTETGWALSDLGLAYGNYVFSQFIR